MIRRQPDVRKAGDNLPNVRVAITSVGKPFGKSVEPQLGEFRHRWNYERNFIWKTRIEWELNGKAFKFVSLMVEMITTSI